MTDTEFLSRIDKTVLDLSSKTVTIYDTVVVLQSELRSHLVSDKARDHDVIGLKAWVYGNGKPGARIELDRLTSWHGRMTYILTGIIVPITIYTMYQIVLAAIHAISIPHLYD